MMRRTTPMSRVLPLKGARLAKALFVLASACGVAQLFMGGDLLAILLCLTASAAGLVAFAALGPYNVGAWTALFYVVGNTLVAIYSKTMLGQALDSNLFEPVLSFFALVVGAVAMLLALLLARRAPVGRPVFEQTSDPRRLRWLSWGCFFLGVAASVLNRIFSDTTEDQAFGGLAVFRDLLLMAVIARTAMLLEKSQERRSFDRVLGVILAASVVIGLIDNTKTLAALPVVSYFFTVLIYRGSVPRKTLIALAIGGAIFSAVMAPFVHAMRAFGQQDMRIDERIAFIIDTAGDLISHPDRFDDFERIAASQFGGGYYNYYGDDGAGQMLLGRYASVQQIDPVIAEFKTKGEQGGDAIWPNFLRLLPSFIYSDKSAETGSEYLILVRYGLIDPAGGKSPSLPIVGQTYAAYGLAGVLLLPFAAFLLLFLVLKKLNWNMRRNVFGIFWFCQFVVVYAGQGSFGQYVFVALRYLPMLALVFWLLIFAARLRIRPAPMIARHY